MSWRRLREGFRSRARQRSSSAPVDGEHFPSTPGQSTGPELPLGSLPIRGPELGGIRTSTIIEVGSSNDLAGVGGGRSPEDPRIHRDRYGSRANATTRNGEQSRERGNNSERSRDLRERGGQDESASSISLEPSGLNLVQDNGLDGEIVQDEVQNGSEHPEYGFGPRLVRWMLSSLRPGALREFTRRRREQIMHQIREVDRLFHRQ